MYKQCPLEDARTQIRLLQFVADEERAVYELGCGSERRGATNGQSDERCDDDLVKTAQEDAVNISYVMSAHVLETKPHYNAISYPWGDLSPTRTIVINDRQVPVRENCWYALYQDERATQPLRAYRSGTVNPSSEHKGCLHNELVYEVLYKDGRGTLERIYKAAIALGNRDYWTRAWIQQELTLLKYINVLCGAHCMPWYQLRRLVTELRGNDASLKPHVRGLDELALRLLQTTLRDLLPAIDRAQAGSFWTIDAVLRQEFACSDPRDRIYSMLKIIDWPRGLSPVVPDYFKTPFQLARESMGYYRDQFGTEFGFARRLMMVLQVADDDVELVKMLHNRQQALAGQSTALRREGEEKIFQRGLLMRIFGRHGKLELSSNGSLSAPFEIIANADDGTKWLANNKVPIPPGLQGIRGSARNYVAAIVTSQAQPDDVLLDIGWGQIVLVVREQDQILEIVGSGIVLTAAGLCLGGNVCNCFGDGNGMLTREKRKWDWNLFVNECDFWALVSSLGSLGWWDVSEAAFAKTLEFIQQPVCGFTRSTYAFRSPPMA
ncbi:hypothetical protein LTR08_007217 [Meristemomyces frigidus]|nr:hypothetical protein LTR08_007217 [Meristemomyces frigidus]